MDRIDFDLILPCYDPPPGWEKSVEEHYQAVAKLLPEAKINLIIVDDGSSKNVSSKSVDYLKARINDLQFIRHERNHGKGRALRAGVAASRGPLQICTDVDFPYKLADIKRVADELRRGADIVCGVRARDYGDSLPLLRRLASRSSRLLNGIFLTLPFNDTQSGLKGFNGAGREVLLRTTIDRYLMDTEFLALAAKTGKLKIVPLEVSLRSGVALSRMGPAILLRELVNFLRVVSAVSGEK